MTIGDKLRLYGSCQGASRSWDFGKKDSLFASNTRELEFRLTGVSQDCDRESPSMRSRIPMESNYKSGESGYFMPF